MRGLLAGLLVWLAAALGAAAQDLSALARFDPAASSIARDGDAITLDLAIAQPVPWRVRLLADPPRPGNHNVDFTLVQRDSTRRAER